MYSKNIVQQAKDNTNFRTVLHTGVYSQLVVMSIPAGGDIGEETHDDVDQILCFVQGTCEATLNGEAQTVGENDVVFVPAGTLHNFVNTGDADLKLFTVYSPPEHPDGTVHVTKADAHG